VDIQNHINCVQDFNNLLADKALKARTLAELQEIYNKDDSKTLRATTLIDPEDPKSDWNTEEIDNPCRSGSRRVLKVVKLLQSLLRRTEGKSDGESIVHTNNEDEKTY